MDREQLISEVNDYLGRLADAGDQAAIAEVLGVSRKIVNLQEMSTDELQWIYDNYVVDDE